MTGPTSVTGRDAVVTIDGVPMAWADFKMNFKQGIVVQSRGGMNSDRKQPGKKDMDFSLTNIDINGDHLGKLLSGSVVAATRLVLNNCDTIGDWTASDAVNTPIAAETLIKKEGTSSLKISPSGAGSTGDTVEATVSKDLTGYHMIETWVYSSVIGAILKFGFGEAAATEQETTITIQKANTWQHVYIDISTIANTAKDAVTKIRWTYLGTTAGIIYVDDINGLKGMKVGPGVKFDLSGEVVDPADSTKFLKVIAKNCFLTSGSFDFGDASKNITTPISGTMCDMDTDLFIFPS